MSEFRSLQIRVNYNNWLLGLTAISVGIEWIDVMNEYIELTCQPTDI